MSKPQESAAKLQKTASTYADGFLFAISIDFISFLQMSVDTESTHRPYYRLA